MFLTATLISLACLTVPVSSFVRMLITGPRVRAEILAHMGQVRCEHTRHHTTGQADR